MEVCMENKNDLVKPGVEDESTGDKEMLNRRNFLRGLGKWSLAVIGCAALGSVPEQSMAGGWVNRRGSWVNGPGAGGWVNRGGTWINGGGGGAWVNGAGGGAWVNRRGW